MDLTVKKMNEIQNKIKNRFTVIHVKEEKKKLITKNEVHTLNMWKVN